MTCPHSYFKDTQKIVGKLLSNVSRGDGVAAHKQNTQKLWYEEYKEGMKNSIFQSSLLFF